MKKLIAATLLMTGIAVSSAQAKNLVEVAQDAGTFNTLIAAAQAAGLADALATGENLTVFAPTDAAFAKLPAGTVEDLLKPENKDKLAAILSYHVIPQKITADMISSGSSEVTTLKADGDKTVTVTKSDSGVMVDGANVISADIAATNGVIHVIDTVVLPTD